ncbi:MAG: hypothetical protein R3B84_15995 [Zavarzinella sp.]
MHKLSNREIYQNPTFVTSVNGFCHPDVFNPNDPGLQEIRKHQVIKWFQRLLDIDQPNAHRRDDHDLSLPNDVDQCLEMFRDNCNKQINGQGSNVRGPRWGVTMKHIARRATKKVLKQSTSSRC